MAAMAPALTDAPNEAAHRIRFKLAPPSSALSPSATETTQGSENISPQGTGPGRRAEEAGRGVGKLQPLVASYLCSDVTPVPSSKLQALLPSLLPPSGPPRRSLHSPPQPPLNGQAKKQSRNPGLAMNGDTLPFLPQTTSGSTEQAPLIGGVEPQTGVPTNPAGCPEQLSPPATAGTPSDCPDSEPTDRPPSLTQDYPTPATTTPGTVAGQESNFSSLGPERGMETSSQLVTRAPVTSQDILGAGQGDLGLEGVVQGSAWLQERAQHSQGRQGEMAGRLRHLKRRLQVVQAKQVERHLQQQLDGLLEKTVGETRGRGQEEKEGIGRLLKQGTTPVELQRLCLSGSSILRSVEAGFDSDATASSSGGETDAEEDEPCRAELHQRHISLWRRAEGRYALERASIISHWSWLQAHVSDLEYRIRQHTDIYRQLRLSKGSILLGDPAPSDSLLEDGEMKTEPAVVQVTQERGLESGAGSSGSVSIETGLRKGCVSGRQVNGVINSLINSPSSAQPEEQQWKQQQQPQFPLQEHASTAARTRPLLSYKRRRLLRPSALSNLHRKKQGVCWCVCEVNPHCVTCGGRPSSSYSSVYCPELQYDRPLLERLAQFDPSLHPILSLSDDVAMGHHLQRMLKWELNSRPLNKIKPLKKLSLKHRLSSCSSSTSSSFSKNRHKLSSSSPLLSSGRAPHSRARSDKLHRQQLDSLAGSSLQPHYRGERSHAHNADKPHPRKRPRSDLSLTRIDSPPAPSKLYMDPGSLYPCPHPAGHPLSQPLTHSLPQAYSPLVRQLSTEASSPFTLSCSPQQQPTRRRRGESSFDINNIVIPMSVAATTRVEKLQYKEIITPSWREVDVCSRPPGETEEEEDEEEGVEVEDLSDQVFSRLHQPCEDQERTRYRWAAVASTSTAAPSTTTSTVAKRRGSRSYKSVDGRTTPLLCSTTPSTPQPSSPDSSHFQVLQDYGSSPCSPASPDLLYAPSPYGPGARDPHRLLSSDDTRCSTPDNSYEDLVPLPVLPWEQRSFPLDSEPEREPEEEEGVGGPGAPLAERPYRTLRRTSTCRTAGSSRSESDTGEPPSPLPDDISRQRHTAGLAHRHGHR